ncbi:hypothetical protein C5167_028941 [Papaver somniferum]|nr:hypothetical protein C5167_028941 [Papaver somniferum]
MGQVIYELNVGGVDAGRLIGAKLEKLPAGESAVLCLCRNFVKTLVRTKGDGGSPQLTTIGADKTLAIWGTISFKELRRIKPVLKLACHTVASWCHPRAPNLDILTCVKDCYIWAIEHPTYSALTRPLCELSSLAPPQLLAFTKKLRVYCVVAAGTNIGVSLSEFDARSLPAVASLPTPSGGREHSAVYLAIVWPDIPYFRCARLPVIHKPGSARKGKEAAACAASSATVQVHIIFDDGTSNILTRSIDGRSEPVIGLHGGALLGVAYRTSRRINVVAATSISSVYTIVRLWAAILQLGNFSACQWPSFPARMDCMGQNCRNCAFAYQQYNVICSLHPRYRYLADVAIPGATGAVRHQRQLFVATPTTIECAFVDAGVAPIDIETKRRTEEINMKEAQARAVSEHGELA